MDLIICCVGAMFAGFAVNDALKNRPGSAGLMTFVALAEFSVALVK